MAAAVHAVAAAALLFVLRPGLPPNGDEARITFINSHRVLWTVGWLCWSLAALSLVALIIVVGRRVGSLLPLVLVLGGALFDLTSQARYILEMPATRGPRFQALDRQLEVAIGGVANGLYTLAIAALILRRDRIPIRIQLLAIPVVVAGAALAIAAFQHHPTAEIITSALLFPTFILWSVEVGRWLRRDA